MTRHPAGVQNVAGEISVADLPALYDVARIAVSVDTGPTHIAGATRTALVVVGSWCPFGRDGSLIRPNPDAVAQNSRSPNDTVTVQVVIDAVERALAR